MDAQDTLPLKKAEKLWVAIKQDLQQQHKYMQ
jgi:hypothetical protein